MKPIFFAGEDETGVTFVLTAMTGATGTPANPYAATEVSPALYQSTPDISNLSGEFRIVASNGDGEVMYAGYWRTTEARCYDYTYVAPVDVSSIQTTLNAILVKTNLIGSPAAFVNSPLSPIGKPNTLVKGTDYLAANGRALIWTLNPIAGFTAGTAVAKLTITEHTYETEEPIKEEFVGTTEVNGDKWQAIIEILEATTLPLPENKYNWCLTLEQSNVVIACAFNDGNCDLLRIIGRL